MNPLWWLTRDGDRDCLALYERHYSAYRYRDGRKRSQFVGPGEKVVLRTLEGDAVFVWRRFIDDSGQEGVNCAVFRNESTAEQHNIVAYEEDFLEDGEIVVCSCGARSPRATPREGREWHASHTAASRLQSERKDEGGK